MGFKMDPFEELFKEAELFSQSKNHCSHSDPPIDSTTTNLNELSPDKGHVISGKQEQFNLLCPKCRKGTLQPKFINFEECILVCEEEN